MASWKKIALAEDLMGYADQGGTEIAEGQVVIGSATAGQFSFHDMAANTIIAGNGGDAKVVTSTGEVTITAVDDTNATFTISDDTITGGDPSTNHIKDNTVAYRNVVKAAGGAILVHQDTSTVSNTAQSTDYTASALGIGDAGDVLKVAGAGSNLYLEWGAGASATSVTITDGTSQTDPLPVIYGQGVGSSQAIYADTVSFTFDEDTAEGGTLAVPHIVATSAVITNVTGTASQATAVLTTAAVASSPYRLAMVPAVGTGSNYQNVYTDDNLTYNPGTNYLYAKNIKISGNSTSIDTATLEVQDKTIVLATSATNTDAADAAGSGLVIDINSLAQTTDVAGSSSGNDAFCPRLFWTNDGTGAADTSALAGVVNNKSSIGWRLADVGTLNASDVPTEASQGYNIAPTLIEQANIPSSEDIGIGAMWLIANSDDDGPALYIQID